MAVDFKTKNDRRKAAKAANPGEFREGRRSRASLVTNGEFGTEVTRVYNACVVGTSGLPHQGKASSKDYDDNADYDH